MRQDEAQWPNDMRCDLEQYFAFGERLAHQREFELLQITQAAVNQLGAGTRRVRGKVIPFAKAYRKAASCGITGDASPIDAAADNQ